MKILFLFSNSRAQALARVKNGQESDDHFYGMLRLRRYGLETDFAEIEHFVPKRFGRLLRSVFNVYIVHLLMLPWLMRADVVFTPTAYGTALVLSYFRKPKVVLYDFGIAALARRKGLRGVLLRHLLKRAAGIITISEKEARDIRIYAPQAKVSFIPLGIDTRFFAPQEAQGQGIFSPGLAPERDYKTLFAATAPLKEEVLVSRSRTVEGMQKLPAHVRSKFLSPLELRDELVRAKIVVLTLDISDGRNEASGASTALEAMAMGKALIATRTSTLESYIEDGVNGILVPPKDSAALTEAIERLLQDSELRGRLGSAARRTIEERCDADKSAERMATFFKSLG